MHQAELRHRIGNPRRFVGGQRSRLTGGDVAERAGAGAGVAHDHHGGVALRPALADVGAGGLLAHRDEAVGAHQGAGLVVDRMVGRLYPDPGGLALDRVVRAVRLLRMAQRRSAVVDDEAGRHDGDVAGGAGGVKRGRRLTAARPAGFCYARTAWIAVKPSPGSSNMRPSSSSSASNIFIYLVQPHAARPGLIPTSICSSIILKDRSGFTS